MSRIIIALTAAIVILLNTVGFFMGRQLINQAKSQVSSAIESTCEDFDDQIDFIDRILENIVTDNISFKYLGDAYDANDIYLYARQVSMDMDDAMLASDLWYYSFVFHAKKNSIHSESSIHLSDERSAGLYAYLENMAETPANITTDKWLSVSCGEYFYLIKVVKYKNAYAGMVVVPDNWDYFEQNLGYSGSELYIISGDEIVANNIGGSSVRNGKYIKSTYELGSVPIEIMCLLHEGTVLGAAGRLSSYVFCFSLILCLFIPFLITLIRKHLFAPLKMMDDKIANIRYGTPVVPLEEVPAKETAEVFLAFDQLMDEINELKIKAYEEKISMQKYKLQYLMLQLKPHFYLNFLKAVYALAGSEKYEEIQSMTKAMSEHFRYVVYNDSSIVTVREEIRHAENYCNIQRMGHMFDIDINYKVSSEVLGLYIPTLCIQTFVENSIKYAKPEGNVLKIDIKAALINDEDTSYIDITITDNGVGYDEEMIKRAENGSFEQEADSHVGLSNLYNRLKILYEDRMYMILGKTREGGALSELVIPAEDVRSGHKRD